MDIRDFVNLTLLEEVMTIWSKATGMATIAMDSNGEYLTGEVGFTDFCTKYTRGSKEGLRRCIECDANNNGVYFCHAGLMDFSFDIRLEDGTYLGKIIGGQILPQEPQIEKFCELADAIGVKEFEYIEALSKIKIRPEEAIRASAELLGRIVNLLVNSEYVKKRQESVIVHLDEENKLDPMTRVYNKAVMEEFVNERIKEGQIFGLIMVDVDNFKEVNDNFGHMIGDYVLKTFAWRMKNEFRQSDIVGRFGGDEFYLIVTGEKEWFDGYGQRICNTAKKVRPSGMNDEVTVSVGIAMWPEHGEDFKSILDSADKALYEVKKKGKGSYAIYGN